MRNQMSKMKIILIMLGISLLHGCLQQEGVFIPSVPEVRKQCVTPIRSISMSVSSGGISATEDGSLFGVATNFGVIYLLNNEGEILWTREGIGSSYAFLLGGGKALLAESYNKEKKWESTIIELDSGGNVLWERQTGLIGVDGLAVTPDGSFIAVGATDQEKRGHLMLFDQNGNMLWDQQIDGRIETVAVSKSGYVVAGPRDRYIYVYDHNGELVFKYFANSLYDTQDTAIAPDETFFLFASEHKYLNCYTLHGELLWQKEVGALCNIRISADGEYIVVGSHGKLFLFNKDGNELWDKKVTDAYFIEEVAISADAEYIAINVQEGDFLPRLYVNVYNKKGELLWQYEGDQPFMAIAMSDDGHYIAAGNSNTLVFFDNFKAIEEYRSSECAQSKRYFIM